MTPELLSDYTCSFSNQRLRRYYDVVVPMRLKENAQDFHRRAYEWTYNILPSLKTFVWGMGFVSENGKWTERITQ